MNVACVWQQLFCVILVCGFHLSLAPGLRAEDVSFAAAAEHKFRQAQDQFGAHSNDVTAAWQFARTCFDFADFATNKAQRAHIAELGISASQQALSRDSNSPPAHYYYAMNIAQLAQTKGLGALKLVRQMEREFNFVREKDEFFDFAGPDRNLGLLYRDAPSIGSIGSRTKAREHLFRAVELAAEYPENHLNLIESLLKWGQRDNARAELRKLEVMLPTARTKFSGPDWAPSWADWDRRLATLKGKLPEHSTDK